MSTVTREEALSILTAEFTEEELEEIEQEKTLSGKRGPKPRYKNKRQIHTYFEADEITEVEQAAERKGITRNDFIRQAAMKAVADANS